MLKNDKTDTHQKIKKTNEQKRLIANRIALGCFCAMIASTLPGLIANNAYDNDIKILNEEQNAIYEKFMACEEFSDSFKEEFTKISSDYANGIISYEEFDEKVQHLNSIKYAQEVLENSNNTDLKAQIEDINKQKQERTQEYKSNIIPSLSVSGVALSGVGLFSAIIASTIYDMKESNEEKRKKKANKIKLQKYETGPVLIDKKFTYCVYDHKETKTENTIEEENDKDTLIK